MQRVVARGAGTGDRVRGGHRLGGLHAHAPPARDGARLPGAARDWAGACRPRDADAARRLLEDALRCAVVDAELAAVAAVFGQSGPAQASAHAESSLKVAVSRRGRSVTSSYTRDECVIEMTLKYDAAYPLRALAVDFGSHQGIEEKTARRWALQLRASASLKSTHAAVLGWRENVDLEFDGVEPCPICYGVLHPKSKRLPHLECRQCHNKFHASCLAHWFSTSHKHLCVVCQTEFVAVKSTKKDPKRDAPPPPPAAPAAPLYDDNELD